MSCSLACPASTITLHIKLKISKRSSFYSQIFVDRDSSMWRSYLERLPALGPSCIAAPIAHADIGMELSLPKKSISECQHDGTHAYAEVGSNHMGQFD